MNITIDNHQYEVREGTTVLDAAENHGIYIPHLCSHRDLTPYGGCRLCVVEIEGVRGYPTACTAAVQEGMVVHTENKALRELRRFLVQLILSEHPSGCLVCADIDGCTTYQETIRKVGVTTGCRWCPKDKICELQKVVSYLDITELTFPVLYRGLELEKYDPFFDRDYNLCIYCSRCVRVCSESRKSSVLSLRQRGKLSTIGTAFDETHVRAGCEFCGACVSACPTGAMSEKSRKWWGEPDAAEEAVCPLCSVNCELQVLTKGCRIVGTIPPGDYHYGRNELCVKGRFCLIDLVNRTPRVQEPEFVYPEGVGIVSWDEAASHARDMITVSGKDRTAVFLSPMLTLEEMGMAWNFARHVLNTVIITSSVLTAELAAFLSMGERNAPVEELKKAAGIVSFWLNGNYGYAPITLAIKRAASGGAPYVQCGWLRDTTSRYAGKRIAPVPGEEARLLEEILEGLETGSDVSPEARAVIDALKGEAVMVVGPSILDITGSLSLLVLLKRIAGISGARILAPDPYGNVRGLLGLEGLKTREEVDRLLPEGTIDLLYLVGDLPFASRPAVKSVIYQGPFSPPVGLEADLVLPAALWGETGGTFTDYTGKKKLFRASFLPPGKVLLNSDIFCRLAKACGVSEGPFTDEEGLRAHRDPVIPAPSPMTPGTAPVAGDTGGAFLLVQERNNHVYQGLSLSNAVAGFGEIAPAGTLIITPDDARALNVKDGGRVEVHGGDRTAAYPVSVRTLTAPGTVYLVTGKQEFDFRPNPCPVEIRSTNV